MGKSCAAGSGGKGPCGHGPDSRGGMEAWAGSGRPGTEVLDEASEEADLGLQMAAGSLLWTEADRGTSPAAEARGTPGVEERMRPESFKHRTTTCSQLLADWRQRASVFQLRFQHSSIHEYEPPASSLFISGGFSASYVHYCPLVEKNCSQRVLLPSSGHSLSCRMLMAAGVQTFLQAMDP